jgi:hypothetical protein
LIKGDRGCGEEREGGDRHEGWERNAGTKSGYQH